MKKRTMIILGGVALAALSLAVPASHGQSGADEQDDAWGVNSRTEARLEAELARLQAQLTAAQGRLNGTLGASQAKLEAKLEAQQAKLYAKLARQEQAGAQIGSIDGSWFISDGDSGWLGISIDEVNADKAKELKLSAERGVVVTEVEEDSPAAKAGLKVNDVILEYNGQRVEGTVQLTRLIRETPAGRTVPLTVWRDGRSQTISAQLGDSVSLLRNRVRVLSEPRGYDFSFNTPFSFSLPKVMAMPSGPVLGIGVQDVEGQLGNYFGAPDGEGVLITEVHSSSAAEKGGLKAGDVITKIDGTRVRTTSDLRSELRDKRDKKSVSVTVMRKGSEATMNVEIEQPKPPTPRRTVGYRTLL